METLTFPGMFKVQVPSMVKHYESYGYQVTEHLRYKMFKMVLNKAVAHHLNARAGHRD
jgi:hypothetical protein